MAERSRIAALPDALDQLETVLARVGRHRPIVFCDYDGTLAPIVENPSDAVMPEPTRRSLERLARVAPVVIVSGRDLDDVRQLTGLAQVWYAGSHGFDVAGPNGEREQHATEYLPDLDSAEAQLRRRLESLPGSSVERKRFAVAVHYRRLPELRIPEVEAAVDAVAASHGRLRRTGGKRVFELRPAVAWDKGQAMLALLRVLDGDGDAVPIFVGDDVTDEDAFDALRCRATAEAGAGPGGGGIAIVVRGEDDQRVTAAEFVLADPAASASLFDALAAHVEAS